MMGHKQLMAKKYRYLSGGGKRVFRAQESRRAGKRDRSRERQDFKYKEKDGELEKREKKRERM